MLFKLLQTYYIITISLFASVIAKVYTNSNTFLDAFLLLCESKNYFFVLLNFALAVGILLFIFIQHYFLGVFQESEYLTALNDMNGFIFTMIYIFARSNINFMTFHFLDLLFSKYIVTLANVRLESLTVNTQYFTAKTHRRMLLLQLSLFLYCFSEFVFLMNHLNQNIINAVLMCEFFVCCESLIEGIIKQFIIINDEERGNSIHAFYSRQTLTVMGAFLSLVIYVYGVYYCWVNNNGPENQVSYLILSLCDLIKKSFSKIVKHRKWKKFVNILKTELPTPTDEEIEEHETCIICRSKLGKEDSRKLPCGHIFHVDCMIVWFGTRQICPLCNADIHDILQNIETDHNNEENNENQNEENTYQFVEDTNEEENHQINEEIEPNSHEGQNDEIGNTFNEDENSHPHNPFSLLNQHNHKLIYNQFQSNEMNENNEIQEREANPFYLLQRPTQNDDQLPSNNLIDLDRPELTQLPVNTDEEIYNHVNQNEKKYTKADIIREITEIRQILGGFQTRLDTLQEMLMESTDI